MILARYINSYQDEIALSQAEILFRTRELAYNYYKQAGYDEDEIDIDTSNCDEYGWEFQTIDCIG